MDKSGMVSVAETAEMCGVSDDTVRRRLAAGTMPGARREFVPNGPWRIPLSDLVAAGLSPSFAASLAAERSASIRRHPAAGVRSVGPRAGVASASAAGDEVGELREALAAMTARAARAEALAEARAEHAASLLALLSGRTPAVATGRGQLSLYAVEDTPEVRAGGGRDLAFGRRAAVAAGVGPEGLGRA